MSNRIKLALVFVLLFVMLSVASVAAQRFIDGGSVGIRAGEIAQAVMVALTSLLMTWMSRG